MYALFYCADFNPPAYQLGHFTELGHFLGSWETTISDAISNFECDTNRYVTDILCPDSRIARFSKTHDDSKSIQLIAQAPTIEDILTLHPEVLI